MLRRFYIRRALRIAPIYYLTLVVVTALNLGQTRSEFFYNALYLSNIHSILENSNSSLTGHFWSLAVEEQFYLVWPFVILFSPRRWLLRILVGAVVLAPAFRLLGHLAGLNYYGKLFFPLGCLDLLGLGAVLAYVHEYPAEFKRSAFALKVIGSAGGLIVGLYCLAGAISSPPPGMETLVLPTALGMAFMFVVDRASRGFGGAFGAFLSCRPVVYLGKISYGLYLLHPFVSDGLSRIDIIGPGSERPFLHMGLTFAATVVLASVSWKVVESPFNKLKSKYPYFPSQGLRRG